MGGCCTIYVEAVSWGGVVPYLSWAHPAYFGFGVRALGLWFLPTAYFGFRGLGFRVLGFVIFLWLGVCQ